METDKLTHLGIDAYLQGRDGGRLPLGPPSVDGNQITTLVEMLENPKPYCLKWCKNQDSPSINAWCEIFRPSVRVKSGHRKIVRVANHFMSSDDDQTQSRSSKGRLELPLQRDAWLWTPRSGSGFVSLEIRRLRTPPKETERPDEANPGSLLYEVDMDMLDDDAKGMAMPPYIIFRFEFKPIENGDGKTSPVVLSGKKRLEARRSTLHRKRVQRIQSSDLSELSSSEPEPEGTSAVASSSIDKRKVVNTRKDDPQNNNKRSQRPDSEASEQGIDVLLKKRKAILREQGEIEEAKKLKRAKHEMLIKALQEDTDARAEKLLEVQYESQQIDDEIEKMEAALQMR
ncbi:hypothetical protein DFH07DRAFT_795656 [Mycena maculata]|uniref:Uncharacterized protein n=1 Tax=Mycena maculata TaxID=230809 RepID=A0AAD7NX07_9AGAR|nr:hypothetical protein DFH07DRAFT_795656 [Mycena maculata]